ncbi:MBL fold metallo-hydrolase [Microbispora catharanthi]|uniref:MBL fold metallo-hydrolase n=1 Tax=Microbispora catharanthi TaxID=1712871 RepID=A0A5N6BI82_9ACTN|nr:MBL fold metallo-hydrolase [Microbispora catharanthi]KAB8180135.1 MBL fold metallo-hydrolase [Microbispora catharanthi]
MNEEIAALSQVATWPNADRRTRVVLASQFTAAGLDAEGFGFFAELSSRMPGDGLLLALAGAFQSRLDGQVEAAIAKLDAAASLDLGLPHYYRGISLAGLPECAGRAETVVADLEFVLMVKDQFPPGFMRPVHAALSRAYDLLGRAEDATRARGRAGHLITDYWANPEDGFRFVPPRLVEHAPGVHVAQGYDFADVGFVVTGAGVVAIDAASTPEHAAAALRELRAITELPVTHVILTHAHLDHVGGLDALTADGATVIAQANFPRELALQNSGPPPLGYYLPRGHGRHAHVSPGRLVDTVEKLTIGGVDFTLIPIAGGETEDGLVIHLPSQEVAFIGDMCMPYLGSPTLAEGSPQGLFDAMRAVMDLRPRTLIHGHPALTENYPIEAFPGLLAALRDLERVITAGISDGLTLAEILRLNHLPDVLRDHPAAVMPYLVTRDNFIQRVHRQRTGYWHRGGEGVERFTSAELSAALDLLGGRSAAAFVTAGLELARRGEHPLALHVVDLGLLSHADAPELVSLRQSLLESMVARNQLLNPFKFMHYASLAGLELEPAE